MPLYSELVGHLNRRFLNSENEIVMKETKILKNRWLHIRLDEAEYNLLHRKHKKSTERYISQYARKILLGEPIIARVRNESLQEIVTVLNKLQKDLNGIGNNYNQMLHKLHVLDRLPEYKAWIMAQEKDGERMKNNIQEIRDIVTQTAEKWLQ